MSVQEQIQGIQDGLAHVPTHDEPKAYKASKNVSFNSDFSDHKIYCVVLLLFQLTGLFRYAD